MDKRLQELYARAKELTTKQAHCIRDLDNCAIEIEANKREIERMNHYKEAISVVYSTAGGQIGEEKMDLIVKSLQKGAQSQGETNVYSQDVKSSDKRKHNHCDSDKEDSDRKINQESEVAVKKVKVDDPEVINLSRSFSYNVTSKTLLQPREKFEKSVTTQTDDSLFKSDGSDDNMTGSEDSLVEIPDMATAKSGETDSENDSLPTDDDDSEDNSDADQQFGIDNLIIRLNGMLDLVQEWKDEFENFNFSLDPDEASKCWLRLKSLEKRVNLVDAQLQTFKEKGVKRMRNTKMWLQKGHVFVNDGESKTKQHAEMQEIEENKQEIDEEECVGEQSASLDLDKMDDHEEGGVLADKETL